MTYQLDLSLAQMVISVKSVQTEMYRALGSVFIARDIVPSLVGFTFVGTG